VNRRVRSRTHGGVGGREGRPSLLPNYLRNAVNMLVQSEAAQDAAIVSLRERIARVEQKVCIAA
jgi:hypothetical protein